MLIEKSLWRRRGRLALHNRQTGKSAFIPLIGYSPTSGCWQPIISRKSMRRCFLNQWQRWALTERKGWPSLCTSEPTFIDFTLCLHIAPHRYVRNAVVKVFTQAWRSCENDTERITFNTGQMFPLTAACSMWGAVRKDFPLNLLITVSHSLMPAFFLLNCTWWFRPHNYQYS